MRPIWKGAISFGMVTIPIKIYPAVEDKDVHFHMLHKKDLAPIQQKRFCTAEDVEVPWGDIVRGVEVSDGEYVAVDPAEIEDVEPETAHTVEIGDFVELTEIDPIYFEKSYYLEPSDVGAKPFLLLRRALEETGRIAVARVAIRTKERLATVRVYQDTLVLETMFWPDEIRATSELDLPEDERVEPSSRELQMARSLVEALSGRFEPSQYQDRYRVALEELIERKMRGESRNVKRRKPEPKVIDLMEALEASLAASKKARQDGEPGPARGEGAGRARPKRGEKAAGEAEPKEREKQPARRRRSAA